MVRLQRNRSRSVNKVSNLRHEACRPTACSCPARRHVSRERATPLIVIIAQHRRNFGNDRQKERRPNDCEIEEPALRFRQSPVRGLAYAGPVVRSACCDRDDRNNYKLSGGTAPITGEMAVKGNNQDDDLRVRPGRIRSRGTRTGPKSFFGEVLKAAQKAGYVGPRSRSGGRVSKHSTFGRGRGAALRPSGLFNSTRRVVVKARIARHRGRLFRPAPLAAHIAYLKREGVTRDGEKARCSTPKATPPTRKPSPSAAAATGIISGSSSVPKRESR